MSNATPTSSPHCIIVYGKDKTPAPIAVDMRAKILPLIEPGVKDPNHLYQQLLSTKLKQKINYYCYLKSIACQ